MFLVTWLFDKLGYMPKVTIDSTWPFPAIEKPYIPHEFEFPVKREVAKKTAKKTVKIPKATTRKKSVTKK
jgi:hypothetical protein